MIGYVMLALGALVLLVFWWVRGTETTIKSTNISLTSHSPYGYFIPEALESVDATPDHPVGFGYKICWLTIRSSEPEAVAKTLLLEDARPANWECGLDAAYKGYTFVSPPVEGWVFIVSINLPTLDEQNGERGWSSHIERLTERFYDVQCYGSHRVSSCFTWARFIEGQERRAFAYADGDVLVDRGQPADAEIHWRKETDDEGFACPAEEDVLRVAAEWSIDPMTLEDRGYPTGTGSIGFVRWRIEADAR